MTLSEFAAANDYLRAQRLKSRRFAFDAALGPHSSQEEVYRASAAPLVEAVLEGKGNATCFCYGATGAGKTHTMLGTPEQPGVMVQALADLFSRLEGEEGAAVRLAYIEIYNENVRDLLAPDRSRNLELREDPNQARAGWQRRRRCCRRLRGPVSQLLQRHHSRWA